MSIFFVALSAVIHVYIFCLESLLWGRPKTNRAFGINAETAEQNRLFAFNQGFYNLFLALAALGGLWLGLDTESGRTLMGYALSSMIGAATVLVYSNRKLLRPACVQGVPPLLGLVSLLL